MSQPYRMPHGGQIDRSRPIRFTFDGRPIDGFHGDTVASALLASGQHMVARSFKYHRPRGILGSGSDDPAALIQVDPGTSRTVPNVRATEQEIYDDLAVASQNCWPSLDYDIGALNDWLHPFFPAGFYYKTFMGPPGSWMRFEPLIRAAAGLGTSPDVPDPDRYEHQNTHCDVLVVGGGPAGLIAALAAGRSGARVILCEETGQFGGRLLSSDPAALRLDDQSGLAWVSAVEAELASLPEVTVLPRTTAFGYYGDNFIGLWQKLADHLPPHDRDPRQPRERMWRVRARQVILATGALERPLTFHHNDRPGIMLAGAARTFARRYGVLAGRRVVAFANNDSAWWSAFDLQDCGAEIALILDARKTPGRAAVAEAAARDITVRTGAVVVDTEGRRRIEQISVQSWDGEGSVTGDARRLDCDLLAVSGGWNPNVALFSQSRGKLRYDEDLTSFRPGLSWQRERSVGGANGTMGLALALEEAAGAGRAAAEAEGFICTPVDVPTVSGTDGSGGSVSALWSVPSPKKTPRAFVDLQNDVTSKDLTLAVREGYRSVEHAKRYTTTGMGTDQGKTVNLNAFGLLAGTMGVTIPAVGTTTFRQPYKPVSFAAIAGQHVGGHFHPRRGTPMHAWHQDNGAIFETVGDWLRAWVYPAKGEDPHDAVMREVKAARTTIGLFDASTLGKIDIRGKDSRTFLNRVYTNAWSKLQPGRCRYGLMLGEDGMVMDDGVTSCLADDHFHMTTTTGGAARVMGWLEDYLQTEWPDLDVYLTSNTEQTAVVSVCGPICHKLMADLMDDMDPDPEGFAFMSWRDGHIEGLPVRVYRVSFTGELSYEINIAARYGKWLWEKVYEAGQAYGIVPYGTEASHVLRAEKGFIIVGQETDGTVTPGDLRMDWIVSKKKGDFIGKRSLSRSDTLRRDRKQLVGLMTQDPKVVLEEGAHVINFDEEPAKPVPMLGHVTSSYFSPNLGRSFAMGLVKRGGPRMGETVYVTRLDGSGPVPAQITGTDFIAMKEAGDV